ncbi:MAG: class I SAM-dependent methyltransferase [Candidatus Binatia bacterium]
MRTLDTGAVQRLYTEKAAFYHRFFVDLLGYGRGLEVLLARSGYLRPGLRVLDAGCGTGILTRNLHDLARAAGIAPVTFHGFDLTPAMLAIFERWIAEHGATDIALRQADVLRLDDLPSDWRDFDLIVSSAMLEYLPRDRLVDALRGLGGRLRRDGVLFVCITRRNVLMKWLIEWWWEANMYERAELEQTFTAAGLVAKFGRFPFPYRHLDLWGHVIEARRAS